ncbi:MAG: hypothetical protein R2991_11055 [Thermoanaerobaculia bacterium]
MLVLGPSNYPPDPGDPDAAGPDCRQRRSLEARARRGRACAASLAGMLWDAGLPAELLAVLHEEIDWGLNAIEQGVDKVVVTGSGATGRRC